MSEDLFPSQERGRDASEWVAAQFSLERADGRDWCDLVNPRTGAKHEVKSARPDRRFRIWEDNHRSLTASDGQNVAWYDFVILSSGSTPEPLDHRRMKPATVTQLVKDRGGWNRAGHSKRDGRQHKLPVSEVF
ncbi:hypothetical protein [Natrinema versiforme]|uniref:PD(D/E)XK endonuclease domain-containing protein n=1 Tax=Natrinema versiforme JCM 10478 TaxID=1227496 RepID=L9Y5I4_9EURY|nr:hypothetical protein [Natrinema versiforme]ELY69324.1 hypothetical protein C489_05203 [Natrinema versiforme JCM 10478]